MIKNFDLKNQRCAPCEGITKPLPESDISILLGRLDGWERHGHNIFREFKFENYYQTIAFINAVAWISHCEDHHPILNVQHNKCHVTYFTHALNNLSENDFICAAKVNSLLKI